MTPRSRKYFQRKEYDKWEQGMLDAMYCIDCQALNEFDCLCSHEMSEYDDWESMTDYGWENDLDNCDI